MLSEWAAALSACSIDAACVITTVFGAISGGVRSWVSHAGRMSGSGKICVNCPGWAGREPGPGSHRAAAAGCAVGRASMALLSLRWSEMRVITIAHSTAA